MGLFADSSGKRFRLDLLQSAGTQNERILAILADAWRRAGFDVYPAVLSQAEQRNLSSRHAYPGLASRGGTPVPPQFTSAEVGSPTNRWAGENRGGWSNQDYDRLFAAYTSSLDRDERARGWVQMMTTVNDLVLAYLLFFNVQTRTWVSSLTGPNMGTLGFGQLSAPTTVH